LIETLVWFTTALPVKLSKYMNSVGDITLQAEVVIPKGLRHRLQSEAVIERAMVEAFQRVKLEVEE